MAGVAREGVHVLHVGSRSVAELAAGVLGDAPELEAQLNFPVGAVGKHPRVDEFADQAMRSRQGQVGFLGNLRQAQRASRLLECRQDG